MADQPLIDAADPRIQDIYANDVLVEVGELEISMIFSHDFYANGFKVAKPSVRIILSHDSYMRMVDFWEKRAKLLRRVYMNRTPNLYAGDPEETRKAFDELYPPSDSTTSEKKP